MGTTDKGIAKNTGDEEPPDRYEEEPPDRYESCDKTEDDKRNGSDM